MPELKYNFDMHEAEPSREGLLRPRVFDVIIGTFGDGLPHLVIEVAEGSVEAGAIHTHNDSREEITPAGTVPITAIREIVDHWGDCLLYTSPSPRD